jgi:hypothetical protein
MLKVTTSLAKYFQAVEGDFENLNASGLAKYINIVYFRVENDRKRWTSPELNAISI